MRIYKRNIYNRAGGVYGYSEKWQSLSQMVGLKAKSAMEDMKALKARTLKAGTDASWNRKPEQFTLLLLGIGTDDKC